MNIILDSGLRIKKDHPDYHNAIADLTRQVYQINGEFKEIKLYEDYGDHILVPRYFPVSNPAEVIDTRQNGQSIEINSNIVPKNKRQEDAINFLTSNTKGILQLEPGSGKTVVAIETIARLKQRTLIIAHKDKLLGNWKKEILQFTDLEESDIARLSSKSYEKDLEKKIILATPQTVRYAVANDKTDTINSLQSANIGIFFVDECHIGVGPEQFSRCSLVVNAKHTYGLSATPSRSDGNDDVLNYHLGEIKYFPPEDDELLVPKVYMIFEEFEVYSKHKKYIHYAKDINRARYLNQMIKSEKYLDMVVKYINDAYVKDRTILVLGDRKNVLIELAKRCMATKQEVGIFIPSATAKEKSEVSDTTDLDESFLKKKVVFSTYGAARDGNNRKDLDTLIMSTSNSNVQQSAGRILRPKPGKKQTIVIDFVDMEGPASVESLYTANKLISPFVRSAERRYQSYKSRGWDVTVIKKD